MYCLVFSKEKIAFSTHTRSSQKCDFRVINNIYKILDDHELNIAISAVHHFQLLEIIL